MDRSGKGETGLRGSPVEPRPGRGRGRCRGSEGPAGFGGGRTQRLPPKSIQPFYGAGICGSDVSKPLPGVSITPNAAIWESPSEIRARGRRLNNVEDF